MSHGINESTHDLEQQLFQALVSGDRQSCRQLVAEATTSGLGAAELAREVYWSVLDTMNTLFRNDQISMLSYQYGTRLLRSLVDQAQAAYEQGTRRERTICMFCGESEADDLAAQLVADLAEADGYDVFFGGS
ncbi:MAG: B12-binding domain-containing protein, partial [Phycisphaerales bacterium]